MMNGTYRKPRVDVYTALLAIALAAVIIATIFAYLETADYGDQKYRGAPTVVQLDRAPLVPVHVAFDRVDPGRPALRQAVLS